MKVYVYKEYVCSFCGWELMTHDYGVRCMVKDLPPAPEIAVSMTDRLVCCMSKLCNNYGKWVKANPEEIELEEINTN